jgi:hypothetical protein
MISARVGPFRRGGADFHDPAARHRTTVGGAANQRETVDATATDASALTLIIPTEVGTGRNE